MNALSLGLAQFGLVGFMPPRREPVQIDKGGSGSGGFGALQAPATIFS
jgi:hypothetical protein